MSAKAILILQAAYAALFAPVLWLLIRVNVRWHRRMARPLMSGPLKDSAFCDRIWDLLYDLEVGKHTSEGFIQAVAGEMVAAVEAGEIESFLTIADEERTDLDITLARCLGFLPLKWWYLKLHFMTRDNVHRLHRHRTVVSAQVIIRGELEAQQYNLCLETETGELILESVSLESVGRYQVMLSTDQHCNVHGFRPKERGALRFQFYLRGHDTLSKRFPKRGRHYIELVGRRDDLGREIGVLRDVGRPGES